MTDFQQIQQNFCQYIRQPQDNIPELLDVDSEKLAIYREIMLNNVSNFIDIVFPISQNLLGKTLWQQLKHEFFAKSQNQSPFYMDIADQFKDYLIETQHSVLSEYIWFAELLQYEWLDVYVDRVELPDVLPNLTMANPQTVWQLSTQVWILVYQYPVYQWDLQTTLAQVNEQINQQIPAIIMVWRNVDDHICRQVISPMLAIVVEQLNQQPLNYQQVMEIVRLHFSYVDDVLTEQLIAIYQQLFDWQLLTEPLAETPRNAWLI